MNKQSFPVTLQRVLFDPLSYLHPQRVRFPENLTALPAARAAANELLLAAFRLEVHRLDLTLLAREWVRHWYRLPQTAYLIGCHALRAELAWEGGLLKLPVWASHFTSIALPTDAAPCLQNIDIDNNVLMKTGYARLQAWGARLPKPLAQRFPLLFPPHIDTAPPQPAADPLILTLALQHAQRNPNTLPTDTY